MIKTVVDSLGVDIGSSNIIIYNAEKGLLLEDANALAVNNKKDEVYYVGRDAIDMYAREPIGIEVVRPLSGDIIKNGEMLNELVRHYITSSIRKRQFSGMRLVFCLPSPDINDSDLKALTRAFANAHATKIHQIERAFAAAVGMDADVVENRAKMIVDIGSFSSHIAIIADNKIQSGRISRVGGDAFTLAIQELALAYESKEVKIGWHVAEDIKRRSSVNFMNSPDSTVKIVGKNTVSRRVERIEIPQRLINEKLYARLRPLLVEMHDMFNGLDESFKRDIAEHGIMLSGGGAALDGLAITVAESFNMQVRVFQNSSAYCAAKGCAIMADDPERYGLLGKRD